MNFTTDIFLVYYKCQHNLARLDRFISEKTNYSDSKIYIILYNGANLLPFEYSGRSLAQIRSKIERHLTFRNFKFEEIKFINGGFRSKFSIELWIVPKNAEPPYPTSLVPKPKIPTDKTFLYGKEFLFDNNELFIDSVKAEFEREEEKRNKEIAKYKKENPNYEELVEYTPEQIEKFKFNWINNSFSDVLKRQKKSIGVIYYYADSSYFSKMKVRKRLEEGKIRITKGWDISPNQIKIIYGGYRNMLQAEFWVIPRGGKLPKPTPEKIKN